MQKKVAAINDLSGIGKCSLSVAIPILSALKVQCCPFPTAILSSQTGYPEFTFLDFTDEMVKYSNVWKNLKVNFDSIYCFFYNFLFYNLLFSFFYSNIYVYKYFGIIIINTY